MKKYIVSFLVVSTFGLYALYLRSVGDASSAAVSPAPVAETSIPAPTPISAPTPVPTPTPVKVPTPTKPAGQYKDGVYTGVSANAYYGNIQVRATISGGKLTDVQFLDYPQDRGTSVRINSQAMPYLRQEAIQAQSANVNTVSGASDSSGAFRQSLASALEQAKNS